MKKKNKSLLSRLGFDNLFSAFAFTLIIAFILFIIIGGMFKDHAIDKAKALCDNVDSEFVDYRANGTVFNANIVYAECDYLNCDGKKICIKERIVVKP